MSNKDQQPSPARLQRDADRCPRGLRLVGRHRPPCRSKWSAAALVVGATLLLMARAQAQVPPELEPAEPIATPELFEHAGVMLGVPVGFQINTTRLRSSDGPVNVAQLQPLEGVYDGQPNQSLISVSVFSGRVEVAGASERILSEVTRAAAPEEAPALQRVAVTVGAGMASATRTTFSVAGVAVEVLVVGFVASRREGRPVTVVCQIQGQPAHLRALDPVIEQFLATLGQLDAPTP